MSLESPRTVHVVLPSDIDDPNTPSGGNVYDRQVCRGLSAAGWSVREIAVHGPWPRPSESVRATLAATLAALPDGALVLLDGLVACAAPDVVVPAAARLRTVVLVHLPLADEHGLAPDEAAALDSGERATLRSAAAVVATSSWAAHRLVEHHGLPATGVHVAPPGVLPAPQSAGSDAGGRLVSVAAVTPRKGQDVLIEALTTLTGLPWTCTVVGALDRAPDYTARLRQRVAAAGLDDRIRFAGPRTGDDLAAVYATADLLVLASRAETYGMVVTEALARGVPVLATSVGGVPEALGHAPDGSLPGMLVPPDDPTALADALRSWLTDARTRERLGSSVRDRRATLNNWDATSLALASVLERLPRQSEAIR